MGIKHSLSFRRVVVSLLFAFGLFPAFASDPADRDPPARVMLASVPGWLPNPTELDALRVSFDVPGIAIVGLSQCAPTAPINSGFAKLAPNVPVDGQTVFESASLSKPVFAYLVMRLADAGVIDLDRQLALDFQYLRIADQTRYRLLTPRLILSHRSGLPNWVGDTDNPNRQDIVRFLAEPGTSESYSGEAFELLRAYVEFRVGKRLNALFVEHLGTLMPHSSFDPLPSTANAAMGYAQASDPATGRALKFLGGSAGGLVATASDYAQFLSRVCRRAGMSKKAYEQMLSPLTPIAKADLPGSGFYSLGWVVMRMGPQTMIMHDGDNDEFRTFAGFDAATGDGVVILTNGRNGADAIGAILEKMQ